MSVQVEVPFLVLFLQQLTACPRKKYDILNDYKIKLE